MKITIKIQTLQIAISKLPAITCHRYGRFFGFLAFLLLAYILVYLFWYTPLPVYILDRLNLRPIFLPDIVCPNCNNFTYQYVVNNADFCVNSLRNTSANDGEHEIYLLILVASFHANFDARQAIRKSWGGIRNYRRKSVRTLFMFGRHDDPNYNHQIQYELEHFGDVIQVPLLWLLFLACIS